MKPDGFALVGSPRRERASWIVAISLLRSDAERYRAVATSRLAGDRSIKITATRSGRKIGEYSWRVEAVLR